MSSLNCDYCEHEFNDSELSEGTIDSVARTVSVKCPKCQGYNRFTFTMIDGANHYLENGENDGD